MSAGQRCQQEAKWKNRWQIAGAVKKKRRDYGEYNNVLLRVSDVFYHTYESACAITLPLAVFHTEKV